MGTPEAERRIEQGRIFGYVNYWLSGKIRTAIRAKGEQGLSKIVAKDSGIR